MRFPKRFRYRNRVLATVYHEKGSAQYVVYGRVSVNGRRRSRLSYFRSYPDAKKAAKALVHDLAKGSQVTSLTPGQANDAIAALERLQVFFQATGKRVSLRAAVGDWCESASKLPGRTLNDAVSGFLSTVVTVKRKDIAEAVEEFITAEEARTKARDGQRAQVSGKYQGDRAIHLRRFAAVFPNTAVCDLTKTHLDTFIGNLGTMKSKFNRRSVTSAKTRNHYRGDVQQFLRWAVRRDYLIATHRLLEADTMRPERANTAPVQFYSPQEFRQLLERASKQPAPTKAGEAPEADYRALLPLVAIGGMAGLRTSELLSLDWAEVWRVPRHIEVTAGKAKTRQRRLVEVCPALAAWLRPFGEFKEGAVAPFSERFYQEHFSALCADAEVKRATNGLRHSFCSYHYAAQANENLTSQQA